MIKEPTRLSSLEIKKLKYSLGQLDPDDKIHP